MIKIPFENIKLLEVRICDIPVLEKLSQDSEIEKFFFISQENKKTYIQNIPFWNKEYKRNYWGFLIEEEFPKGYICLEKEEDNKDYVSYFIGKQFRGNGLASKALNSIIEFGFNQLNLKQINAKVNPLNEISRQVLIKKGFQKKGSLEKKHLGKKLKYHIYSIIRH